MPKMDPEVLSRYEELMRKDPFSKAFAPLADAYLEDEQLDRAEFVIRDGLRKHVEYAPGLIVYAKILKAKNQFQMAIDLLKKAARIDSENILAHQLMGDVFLEMKKPQEALRSYKMVLFLNPMATKAQKMVQKLESLSAIEFEENTFQMAKLSSLDELKQNKPIETQQSEKKIEALDGQDPEKNKEQERLENKGMMRMISLIDAFLARNDLMKADELIEEAKVEFGSHPELSKRAALVRSRGMTSHLAHQNQQEAVPLQPILSREKQIHEKKLVKLQKLLRKIEDLRL